MSHNLVAVQEALNDDPGAVNEPFWEQKREPPICCAVRAGCPPAVVAELLGRGAYVDAVDVHDCTPYMLVVEEKERQQESYIVAGLLLKAKEREEECDAIARLLLKARAQTTESNAYEQKDTWGEALPPFDAPRGWFLLCICYDYINIHIML